MLLCGSVQVDLIRHEASLDGTMIDLSPTEFRLLELFLRHQGEVLSRRRILSHVWGYEDEPDSNAVDLYVHYLRRKLGESLSVRTGRGIGYRLDPPGD